MFHFGESNSVTRQVSFNRTKIAKKAKIQMRHFEQFLNNVHAEFFKGYLKQTSQNFYGDFCLVLRFFSIFTRLFQSLVQQTRYFFMASSTSLLGTTTLQTFSHKTKTFLLFLLQRQSIVSSKIELETMLAYGKDQAVHLAQGRCTFAHYIFGCYTFGSQNF